MRVVVVAITSVVALGLGGAASARAEGLGSTRSPIPAAAAETKVAPRHDLQKPGAGQSKKPAPTPPGLEHAAGSERDNPVLNLLWLLTGVSRRN